MVKTPEIPSTNLPEKLPPNRAPDLEYRGHKIWITLDHEDDNIKAFHDVQLPSGQVKWPPISPYDRSLETVKAWIDAGYPNKADFEDHQARLRIMRRANG